MLVIEWLRGATSTTQCDVYQASNKFDFQILQIYIGVLEFKHILLRMCVNNFMI
jgi:hypothetical protein